jgi:predicted HicB family RNase H-like nuclease
MAGNEAVAWVQLATRIPKALHRELKLHCLYEEIPLMDFVWKALEEKLARSRGAPSMVRRKHA